MYRRAVGNKELGASVGVRRHDKATGRHPALFAVYVFPRFPLPASHAGYKLVHSGTNANGAVQDELCCTGQRDRTYGAAQPERTSSA